jgi:biotin transport system substrate-specific component
MINVVRKSLSQPLAKIQDSPLLYSLWGVFLLFLCAQISIPLEPVPITQQTVGVMLVGITFPRKIAIQSILSYLAMGAIGFPVFANFSGGYAVFLGPTAGYLAGFLASILVMTYIATKQKNARSILSVFINCLVGTGIVFLCGILGLLPFMDLSHAIQLGLVPFILPGFIKIAFLTVCLKYLRQK